MYTKTYTHADTYIYVATVTLERMVITKRMLRLVESSVKALTRRRNSIRFRFFAINDEQKKARRCRTLRYYCN